MKNFCETAKIFIICLIFSSMMIFSENCQAEDYYVGNYSDGAKAYLMTDTIIKYLETDTIGTSSTGFRFKVKAVYSDYSRIDDYDFDGMGGYFSVNGKRHTGSWSTVEKNIIEYIRKIKWKN